MAAETGGSLVAALVERYCEEEDDETPMHAEIVVCMPVGLSVVHAAAFRDRGLATVGDGERLSECKRLKDLDLSRNSFVDGPGLLRDLTAHLPALATLNISDNPLLQHATDSPDDEFRTLRSLVVDWGERCSSDTGSTTWGTFLAEYLPASCPNLRALSLSGWESLPKALEQGCPDFRPVVSRGKLSHLRELRLERCGISSIGVLLERIGGLASLTSLSVAFNPIVTVEWPEGVASAEATTTVVLPSLQSLNLSNTCISDWGSIDAVGRVASLRHVRLTNIPLLDGLAGDVARMLCIAHLPNVSAGGHGLQTVGSETCGTLNGGPVSRSERLEAEVFRERWDSGEWERFCEASDLAVTGVKEAAPPVEQELTAALTRLH
jgi:hypothetical protein